MSSSTYDSYPLGLPESLKASAKRLAEQDGVSLNQWIVAAVAQKIGAVESAEEFSKIGPPVRKPADFWACSTTLRIDRRSPATSSSNEAANPTVAAQ